jgi:hypothetical protein
MNRGWTALAALRQWRKRVLTKVKQVVTRA